MTLSPLLAFIQPPFVMSMAQDAVPTGRVQVFVAKPHTGAPAAPAAQPVIASIAGRMGPGYVKVHVPVVPVVHVPDAGDGGGVLVTVKVTVTPDIGIMNWSWTNTVTVWVGVLTGFTAVTGLSVTNVTIGVVGGTTLEVGPSSEK